MSSPDVDLEIQAKLRKIRDLHIKNEQHKATIDAALKKAKTTPRSFMPETKDPGFAQNPDDLYLPKVIN